MIKPAHVILLISSYLGLAWMAVITIDVFDMFRPQGYAHAVVWQHLFANGKPIEWAQWYALGASAIMATYVSGRLIASDQEKLRGLAMFWLVMGGALTLMLVEDAGELRHEIQRIVEGLAGEGFLSSAVEFVYFVLLASVPLYALIVYGKYLRPHSATLKYVLSAFVFYGIAGIANSTRNWGGWYAIVGEHIQESVGLVVADHRTQAEYGQWLIDALFEESFELLGVMFFLAAVVSTLGIIRSNRHPRPGMT